MTASAPDGRAGERARLLGLHRLNLFVPALMSVGLLFWIVSELNHVLRSQADDARRRRAQVAAVAVADDALGRATTEAPGLRPRGAYLVLALGLFGAATYVLIGSIANFVRGGTYVGGVAWLMALAGTAALAAIVYGTVATAVFASWPLPPAWARGVLLRSPLGAPTDEPADARPSWRLTSLWAVTAFLLATVTAMVAWAPEIVEAGNDAVADLVAGPGGRVPGVLLIVSGPWAATAAALAAVGLGHRCRMVIVTYLGSVVGGAAVCAALHPVVAGAGASGWWSPERLEAFPSAAVMLVTVFAGLFPVALAVAFRRPGLIPPLRVVLGLGVAATVGDLVAGGMLVTTALGGLLVGLVFVVGSQYLLDSRRRHAPCHGCPWAVDAADDTTRVPARPADRRRTARLAARLAAAAAVVVISVLTFASGLPGQAAAPPVGRGLVVTVGLLLAGTATAVALVAWKHQTVAAVLGAAVAVAVGVFASLSFAPAVAVGATGVLLVPPLLLWSTRQTRQTRKTRQGRRRAEGAVVVAGALVLLAVTGVAAVVVHGHLYGPAGT